MAPERTAQQRDNRPGRPAIGRDFQRLARVRARRRARRRWIGTVVILVGASALAALSQLTAPVHPGRLLASLLERDVPWLRPAESRSGEAQGRVATVEPRTGTIHVSSGLFGLMSVALVVSPETLIVVGNKEGGFGDIREGEQVRAAYEIGRDALRALRVEVLVDVSSGAGATSSR